MSFEVILLIDVCGLIAYFKTLVNVFVVFGRHW